jgi:hypothetical protein
MRLSKANRSQINSRLGKLGIRGLADAYRQEIIIRQKASGKSSDEANAVAWDEMWEIGKPIVERLERGGELPQQIEGIPADLDSVLDPNYAETDQGKQLRDAWLWVVFEWMRVIRDGDEGTVVHIEAASKPPPNAFALFVLSTYALSSVEKRRDLISRALTFASKSHDPDGGRLGSQGDASFLDRL